MAASELKSGASGAARRDVVDAAGAAERFRHRSLSGRLGKVAAYLKIPYPSSFSAATITSSPPAAPSTTGFAKRSSFRRCASSLLFFLWS